MSNIICDSAIVGAAQWIASAEKKLDEAIKLKGENCVVRFPDTAYYLPVIYSFTGEKTETLSALRYILNKAKELLPGRPSKEVWLPYLGNTLDAGVAALFACEIIEACKYVIGPAPVNGIWLGAASDNIMRERGIEFVDGLLPVLLLLLVPPLIMKSQLKLPKNFSRKTFIFLWLGVPMVNSLPSSWLKREFNWDGKHASYLSVRMFLR